MESKEECGCKVVSLFLTGNTIEYCPKHKAAPDLYEALKSFDRYISESYPDNMKYKAYAVEQMEKALARANDKS